MNTIPIVPNKIEIAEIMHNVNNAPNLPKARCVRLIGAIKNIFIKPFSLSDITMAAANEIIVVSMVNNAYKGKNWDIKKR